MKPRAFTTFGRVFRSIGSLRLLRMVILQIAVLGFMQRPSGAAEAEAFDKPRSPVAALTAATETRKFANSLSEEHKQYHPHATSTCALLDPLIVYDKNWIFDAPGHAEEMEKDRKNCPICNPPTPLRIASRPAAPAPRPRGAQPPTPTKAPKKKAQTPPLNTSKMDRELEELDQMAAGSKRDADAKLYQTGQVDSGAIGYTGAKGDSAPFEWLPANDDSRTDGVATHAIGFNDRIRYDANGRAIGTISQTRFDYAESCGAENAPVRFIEDEIPSDRGQWPAWVASLGLPLRDKVDEACMYHDLALGRLRAETNDRSINADTVDARVHAIHKEFVTTVSSLLKDQEDARRNGEPLPLSNNAESYAKKARFWFDNFQVPRTDPNRPKHAQSETPRGQFPGRSY